MGFVQNTANNINFHYRTNSVKINHKIFQYIEKTLFLVHFPNFGGKKNFPGKSSSVINNFIWDSSILEFWENAWTEGRTDPIL